MHLLLCAMVTDSVALILCAAFVCCLTSMVSRDWENSISCTFKNRDLILAYPMQPTAEAYRLRGRQATLKMDTLSNWYDSVKNYVEIVRQDHPTQPTLGIAIGFEFDEQNGEYPYTPSYAVLQLKDFGWGGVEFSKRDTLNYTGISNDVSDDLQIEIEDYRNDTIFGHFSGLLLSGAGPMGSIENGRFAVKVYRVQR